MVAVDVIAKDHASKTFRDVGAAAQDSGKKVGAFGGAMSAAGKIGKLAAGVAGIGAVTVGLAGAKKAIFDFNSQLQNATIGFTTMLGSGQKAQVFLNQLQAFAKSTPFDFGSLVQSSQTLLGMGVNARDIIPDLTALGDSVASVGGSSDQLNNVILAFGQTMAKGTLDMGNMNQLLQGGVPNALKILAAQYHVTTGAMVKMISTGKVQSSQALPLLIQGLEKGTKSTAALGGMMDKQSQTMTGALSNIGDAATQLTAHAFKPLFDATSVGAQKFAAFLSTKAASDWADRTNKAVTSVFSTIQDDANKMLHVGEDFWAGLTDPLDKLPNTWGVKLGRGVSSAFDKAKSVVAPAAAKLQTQLSASIGQAPKGVVLSWGDIVYNGVGLASNKISTAAIKVAGMAQTSLSKAFGSAKPLPWDTLLSKGWDKLKDTIGPLIQPSLDKLQTIWKTLSDAGQKAIGPLISILKTLGTAFGQAFQWISGTGLSVWQLLLKAVQGVADALDKYVVPALQAVATWMKNNQGVVTAVVVALLTYKSVTLAITLATKAWAIATGIATAAQRLLNGAMDANPVGLVIAAIAALTAGFIYLWNHSKGFRDFWIGLWSTIKSVATAVANWFMTSVWPTIKQAFDAIAGVVQGVWKVFQGIVDFVTGVFSGNWSKAWQGIKEIFSGIWDGIKSIASLAVQWFGGLPGKIWDAIKAFAGFLLGRGAALMGWIWQGIQNAAVAVWHWFGGIGASIWNKIKALAGAILGYGAQLISWIGRGISAGASAIWDWVKNIPSHLWSAVKGIASALGNIGAAIVAPIIGGMQADLGKALGGFNKNLQAASGSTAGGLSRAKAFAGGGWVSGNGGPTADDRLIWASSNEFVVNAAASKKWGGLLEAINGGKGNRGPRYAAGGYVAPSAFSLAGGQSAQYGPVQGAYLDALATFRSAVTATSQAALDAASKVADLRQAFADQTAAAAQTAHDQAANVASVRATQAANVNAAEQRVKDAKTASGHAAAERALTKARETQTVAVKKAEEAQTKANTAENAKTVAALKSLNASKQAALAAKEQAAATADVVARTKQLQIVQNGLSAALDRTDASLSAAKDKMAGLKDSRAQLAGSVASAVAGTGGGILGFADQRNTPGSILNGLNFDLGKTQAFQGNIAKLAKLGLNNADLQAIAGAGVDQGGATAAALAGASKAQIGQINSTEAKIRAAANATGNVVAGKEFDPLIKAQQKLIDGLDKRDKDLRAAVTADAKELAKEMLGALDGARFVFDAQGVARLVRQGEAQLARR